MTGLINVAVADFGELNTDGEATSSQVGRSLAAEVFASIAPGLASLNQLDDKASSPQLRSPEHVGGITGKDERARLARAEGIANSHRADVLVYGNLVFGVNSITFIPEFYLGDRLLRDSYELSGSYAFGKPITVSGGRDSSSALEELRDAIKERLITLYGFVRGLDYFSRGDYSRARSLFLEAEAGWSTEDSKEVLYLFLGSVAGRQKDLDAAESFYQLAQGLNDNYVRAQIGLAEVTFQKVVSRVGCDHAHTDDERSEIRKAIRAYDAALSANRPASLKRANIDAKVAFGRGRAFLCLGQSGDSEAWSDAERNFRSVIASSKADDLALMDLAAEAHWFIGFLKSPSFGDEGRPDVVDSKRRAALDEYRKAAEMSPFWARQAVFEDWRAHVYVLLKDCANAEAALARAQTTRQKDKSGRVLPSDHDLHSYVLGEKARVC
jgi:tetratricopeptide (TPR) repeat protein